MSADNEAELMLVVDWRDEHLQEVGDEREVNEDGALERARLYRV